MKTNLYLGESGEEVSVLTVGQRRSMRGRQYLPTLMIWKITTWRRKQLRASDVDKNPCIRLRT